MLPTAKNVEGEQPKENLDGECEQSRFWTDVTVPTAEAGEPFYKGQGILPVNISMCT